MRNEREIELRARLIKEYRALEQEGDLAEEKLQALFYDNYDYIINYICPRYEEALSVVADNVFNMALSVIDIGCGTGNLLKRIVKKNRNIRRVIGVDMNKRSLSICERKFSEIEEVKSKFIEADITRYNFPTMDVCVSSLCIHNLPREEQLSLIRRIIKEYPVFIHFDVVQPETMEEEMLRIEFVKKYMRERDIPPEIISGIINETNQNDSPMTVAEHRACCEKAGAIFRELYSIPGAVAYIAENKNGL